MKIRKAKKEDLKDIDKIYVEGSIDEGKLQFPNVPVKEMIKELEYYTKERGSGFKKEFGNKKHFWIVAIEDDEIVGIGHAYLKGEDIAMLEKIYVSRKHRRKGIGMKIASELIKWLKSKKRKYIESGIYWNNKPSIKLHKRLGFKPLSLKMRLKR